MNEIPPFSPPSNAAAASERVRLRITRVLRRTLLSRRPDRAAAAMALISTLLLALGCLFYWRDIAGAAASFPAVPQKVFENGEYSRLFTALLAHGDLKHLLSNSLLFFILAALLFAYFGPLLFPLAALILGALTNALTLLTYPPETHLIGASGMVYVMGGLWLALYALIERTKSMPRRLVRLLGVILMLWMPTAFDPGTSYRAHAIGFALGFIFGLLWFALKWREFRSHEIWEPVIEEESDPEASSIHFGVSSSDETAKD